VKDGEENETMKDNGRLEGSLFAIMVIATILIILIPFPAIVLDILIGLNLMQSILILLIVLKSKKITSLSFLPTVLLVSMIFGLAINISSVRLILARGAEFDGWAIRTIAFLVTGSGEITHFINGFLDFLLFAAIVAFVIRKGAARITEVSSRFVLDSMPGKQMAIEAEYDSGAISEEESIARKNAFQQESDFYGSMDGAGKFVYGSVKVYFFIIFSIIAGGIALDILIRGLTITDAARTYLPLSIGNGILFLIPALLVLLAASFAVTRSVGEK